jgi:hypothetical protein
MSTHDHGADGFWPSTHCAVCDIDEWGIDGLSQEESAEFLGALASARRGDTELSELLMENVADAVWEEGDEE